MAYMVKHYTDEDWDIEVQDAYVQGFGKAVSMMGDPPEMWEEWRKMFDNLVEMYRKRHPEEFDS